MNGVGWMGKVIAAVLLGIVLTGCKQGSRGTRGATGGSDDVNAPGGADTESGHPPGGSNAPGGDAGTPMAYPPVTCQRASDKSKPIELADRSRRVYCAIDLGSNNAKLVVISMEANKPLSFKDERQCRTRLGFGAVVFDSNTKTARPLPEEQVTNLVSVIREFQRICALDQGVMVGAEATQWARDATNIIDVKATVLTATGLDIEVLTPEQEGQFGYVAATRNSPEYLSLDPGSNSFQIGWRPKGATSPQTVSIPFGYQRAAAKHYPATTPDSFETARTKLAEDLRTQINAALANLTPATDLATLRDDVAAGRLKPEIFLVGQDGALHLAIRAQLRDATGTWISDASAYAARVELEESMPNELYGDITTVLAPSELATWFFDIVKPADFEILRNPPVRSLYGEKVLANSVLLDLLVSELGLSTIVLVPQEMPAGYILSKVQ